MFYLYGLLTMVCAAVGTLAFYYSTNTLMSVMYVLMIGGPSLMFFAYARARAEAIRQRRAADYFQSERDRIDNNNTEIKRKYDEVAQAANKTADLMEGLVLQMRELRLEHQRKITALRDEVNRLRNVSRIQRISKSRANRHD